MHPHEPESILPPAPDRPSAAGQSNGRALNLPNRLTLARVIMVPVFVAIMSFENHICYFIAYWTFVAATITDYYDGKIARERNLITNFGKLFDPVADKVLLSAAFIMLMKLDGLHIPGWTVIAIMAREFLVTGARAYAASEGVVIAADSWGKLKAVYQMVYIFVFLAFITLEPAFIWLLPAIDGYYQPVVYHASFAAILFVASYTAYSGVRFAMNNWHNFRLDEKA